MYNLPFTGNVVTDIANDLITNTKSGTPRLNFKIAVNEGERGTDTEKSHFIPFTAFGSLAENFAKSLTKGMRVTIIGRLNTYEKEVFLANKEGEIMEEPKNLTMLGFTATEGGPALRWASAQVTKAAKTGGNKVADSFADEDAAPAAAAAPKTAKRAPARAAAPAAAANDDNDF